MNEQTAKKENDFAIIENYRTLIQSTWEDAVKSFIDLRAQNHARHARKLLDEWIDRGRPVEINGEWIYG